MDLWPICFSDTVNRHTDLEMLKDRFLSFKIINTTKIISQISRLESMQFIFAGPFEAESIHSVMSKTMDDLKENIEGKTKKVKADALKKLI